MNANPWQIFRHTTDVRQRRAITVSATFLIGILLISEHAVNAQCPAVGQDTTCGTVITVTNTGATVSFTGQGPYDGADDTLVGVVNNSSLPLNAIGLTYAIPFAPNPIFAFDGDGIDTYGIPGNSHDGTGYGGPNAYFTDISADLTSGTVNFVVPLPANGGTGYFSLEAALSSATACTSLINNALSGPSGSGTPTINASFTPNSGYTLSQASQLCGFTNFDWQQTITSWPNPSPLFQVGNPVALSAPPPFLDPPPGGYTYELSHGFPNGDNAYPFYYDPRTSELASYETSTTLSFKDAPADPCLFGGSGSGCAGQTALKGSQLAFKTHLVGVLKNATPQDLGIGFTWTSNFNGTSGGVATTKNSLPVDPGSGTGGITILSVQETTTYQGIIITSINGNPPGAPQPLTDGSSCNGVYSGTFNGNININSGQSCSLVNGTVTGNIFVSGGSLSLSDVLVNGSVQVNSGGTFSINSFSAIQQNLSVVGIPSGLPASQLCDSTIYGTVQLNSNGSGIQLGSTSPSSCGGNVVGENLQIIGNSGPVQVFGNTVTGVLSCDANGSISGGANSAQSKQDQCASF